MHKSQGQQEVISNLSMEMVWGETELIITYDIFTKMNVIKIVKLEALFDLGKNIVRLEYIAYMKP